MSNLIIENVIWKNKKQNFLIEEGVIKKITSENIHEDYHRFDAKGLTLIPGLIDMQVHFREPGFEHKETIETGSMAALAGGVTQVAIMPNTNPVIDNIETIQWIKQKACQNSKVDIHIIPAMTKDLRGMQICNFAEYKKLGIFAITDDGKGVQNDYIMEDIFRVASKEGLSILQHCEVDSLSEGAPIHNGVYAKKNKIKGSPSESEWMMIERDLSYLKRYGGHYHVLHVSSKKSVELIRQAKKDGLNVTAEVTPHHLLLCDEDIQNTNFKMNPPLRSRLDRKALEDAFLDGTIDIVSTDHAPHTPSEKEQSFYEAPFGVIGLETSFALLYSNFVAEGKCSLDYLIAKMSSKPAEIFKLQGGKISEGEIADLVLIDANAVLEVNENLIKSKSKNTPFMGQCLAGWPQLTIKNGAIVYER